MSGSNCLPIELHSVVMCTPSFIFNTYDSEECSCYFLDGKIVLRCLVTCALLSKQQPSPLWLPGLLQPLNRLPLLLLVDYTHVTSILMLVFLFFPPTFCADGGKGVGFVEKNGDQCGRSREENRKEHGEHAGNVHGLPHRNTVGVTPSNLLCCTSLSSDCFVFEMTKKMRYL